MRNRVVIGILGLSVASPGCNLVSTAVHNVCAEARENMEEHWETRRWHRLEARAVSESTISPRPALVQAGASTADVPSPRLDVSMLSSVPSCGKVVDLAPSLPPAALQWPAIVSESAQVTSVPPNTVGRSPLQVPQFIAAWFHSLEPLSKEHPIADSNANRSEIRRISPYAPFPSAGY